MTAAWDVRCGDALLLLRDLPDASVDAVVTDPPYSSGGAFRGDRASSMGNAKYLTNGSESLEGFEGDTRDQRGYLVWTSLWLAECHRVVRPGGVVVVATDWRQLPTTTDALQAGGFLWRGLIPWVKPDARPQVGRFTASSEFWVWGSRGPMPVEGECLPGYYAIRAPRDREHPTEKPVELMRALVRICPAGGLVLDPFAGSGTTLVAAMAEGRRALGFELAPAYAEVARKRCAALENGVDRFADPGQRGLFTVPQ